MEAPVKECIRVLAHLAVHFSVLPNFPIDQLPFPPFFREVGAKHGTLESMRLDSFVIEARMNDGR